MRGADGNGAGASRRSRWLLPLTLGLFLLVAALLVAAFAYPLPAHRACQRATGALGDAVAVREALVLAAFVTTAAALIACAAGMIADTRRLVWYAVAGMVTLVLLVPLEALEWFALDPCRLSA